MESGAREEIRLGGLAIRFLVEGAASGGSVAMFEFDVAPVRRFRRRTATMAMKKRSTDSRACQP